MRRVIGRGIVAVSTLVGLLFLTGCGQAHQTRVFSTPFVHRSDVERYPPDNPARAALELLRALQFNDPAAAATFFTGPSRPTTAQLEAFIQRYGSVVQAVGVPKVVAVSPHGQLATVSAVTAGGGRATLSFKRAEGRWKLLRYRVVAVKGLPSPPRLVRVSDIERYPHDSPARAALELLRALQHGQAAVAAKLVTPAWKLTPKRVAQYRSFAAHLGLPKVLSVTSRGTQGTIRALIGRTQTTLYFTRSSAGWVLSQARIGALRYPSGG
jgi:hypothetical protein